MNITKTEYYAIIRAGVTPANNNLTGFAAACYDANSARGLIDALKTRRAEKTDFENWGISATQWRESIRDALAVIAFMFEFDNGFERI
jgi:hypothetical protein